MRGSRNTQRQTKIAHDNVSTPAPSHNDDVDTEYKVRRSSTSPQKARTHCLYPCPLYSKRLIHNTHESCHPDATAPTKSRASVSNRKTHTNARRHSSTLLLDPPGDYIVEASNVGRGAPHKPLKKKVETIKCKRSNRLSNLVLLDDRACCTTKKITNLRRGRPRESDCL